MNLGKEELSSGPMLHVRGGDGAVVAVLKICETLDMRGFDCSTGEFVAADGGADSFSAWRDYRDPVASGYAKTGSLGRVASQFRKLFRR